MVQSEIELILSAVGELLEEEGIEIGIVVVGGAALNLQGLIHRTTRDVDIIAVVHPVPPPFDKGALQPPEPLPDGLLRASKTAARDFGLPTDWMNTDVALQWKTGLPPSLADDISWRQYHALHVGLVGRRTLISLKLFAAVDGGPRGVHFQDLLNLAPTNAELDEAADWVRTQDATDVFQQMLTEVLEILKRDR